MKIGTVPKITVGVAALIALIFIGFIGVRQMTAPTVEERVYLSPWEDGTPRPQNNTEDLAAQTNSTQDRANRDNLSQSSTDGSELVDDSLGQPQETDTTQLAAEAEFEIETEPDLFTDISTLLDDEGRSPEDVMNIYVEAYKNADFEPLFPLVTGTAREGVERIVSVLGGELPEELVNRVVDNMPEGMSKEMVDMGIQMVLEMYGQAEVVSSEHVGDEFHFRLRIPMPKLPEIPQVPGRVEMPKLPESVERLVKMRKVDGVWQIYDSEE